MFTRYFIAFTFLLVIPLFFSGCSKDSDSDSDNYSEDPRFFGYMEAKVNGELKRWETTVSLNTSFCDPFGCVPGCNNAVQCGYAGSLPEVTETIGVRWDVMEEYGCGELNAWYAIDTTGVEDAMTYYESRDICEGNQSTDPYICHDVSFTITRVRNDIYEGTFSFIASRNCGEDEVVITDGKFEVEIEGPLCDIN